MPRLLAIFVLVLSVAFAPAETSAQPLSEKAFNDQVRAQLAELGDHGRRARPLTHWVYPLGGKSIVSRSGMRKYLEDRGYRVENAASDGGLMFHHESEVASEAFDNETNLLRRTMEQNGWEYDGWETQLVR